VTDEVAPQSIQARLASPARLQWPLLLPSSWHRRKVTPTEKSFSIKAPMAEHIEDLQQRFAELNKRIQLVRSFL
jgi:hypothetical protein